MPLSDLAIKKAAPKSAAYKLSDEGGLYLFVTPAGGKLWRYDYRFNKQRRTLVIGPYPEIPLIRARELHLAARKRLADGFDPAAEKQSAKVARKIASDNTFEAIARAWFAKHMSNKSESHQTRTMNRLKEDIFPWLGKRPIQDIKPPELLLCLRRIEERGAFETTHRVRWSCSKIFRFAIASGLMDSDPADLVKEALIRPNPQKFPTITNLAQVGALLRAIDSLEASIIVRCAVQLAPLTFVRPGELRQAEWAEINFAEATWLIPAEKMKMRRPHLVPLSRQALKILQEIEPLTGNGKYVFPSERSKARPMSENTVNAALRRLGYSKEEFTGHSFRKIASTLLNESFTIHVDAITGDEIDLKRFNKDLIEIQLAHADKNSVRGDYNYAEYLPSRIKMMQWLADYFDKLKAGADIIPLFKCA